MEQNLETIYIEDKNGGNVTLTKKEFDFILEQTSKSEMKHEHFYFLRGGLALPK